MDGAAMSAELPGIIDGGIAEPEDREPQPPAKTQKYATYIRVEGMEEGDMSDLEKKDLRANIVNYLAVRRGFPVEAVEIIDQETDVVEVKESL